MELLTFPARLARLVEIGDKTQSVLPLSAGMPPIAHRFRLMEDCGDGLLHQIGEAQVKRVDRIAVESTSMSLNGRPVHSILHCRDADQTDNEFGEAEGFDGFMDMREFLEETHGLPTSREPFEGFVVHWELLG